MRKLLLLKGSFLFSLTPVITGPDLPFRKGISYFV